MDDDGELAVRYAKHITRGWGCGRRWREYVAACWLGVTDGRAKGISGGRLCQSARWFCHTQLAAERGRRERRRGVSVLQFVLLRLSGYQQREGWEDDASALVPDRRDPANCPERRLLAVWCETRPLRRHAGLRGRVMAYLHFVEGVPMHEVAATFGVVQSAVSHAIGRFRSEVAAGRASA